VIGGMLAATLLAIFLIPVLVLRRRADRHRRRRPPRPTTAAGGRPTRDAGTASRAPAPSSPSSRPRSPAARSARATAARRRRAAGVRADRPADRRVDRRPALVRGVPRRGLRRHVEEALRSNRDLLSAPRASSRRAASPPCSAASSSRRSGFEGDVYASATRRRADGPRHGTQSDYLGVLNAAWELDVWGRIRRATEAARAELLATEAFRRGVVLSLVTGVAQAYFELRELDLELEITRRTTESFRETRDLFERQFRGGVTSKLDYLRGEAALAQAAAAVPSSSAASSPRRTSSSVLLGRPAGGIERGAARSAGAAAGGAGRHPVAAPRAAPRRPPGRADPARRDGADRRGLRQLLPAHRAHGRGGAHQRRARLGALGPELLDHRRQRRRPDLHLRAHLVRVALRRRGCALGRPASSTSSRCWSRWRTCPTRSPRASGSRRCASSRSGPVEALAESLRVARIRYVGGLATYLEVLDAQQQLFPAELDLARTTRDELLAVVALYRALGGGWQPLRMKTGRSRWRYRERSG
jgi:outer membrane protein, multidrug efflux system